MKNIMSHAKKSEVTLRKGKPETEISDPPDVAEEKKIVVKPFQEPPRLYFSSPCLLAEIEDDEDILNR
jgi:hypothetical protein